jgi:hypothetical protein
MIQITEISLKKEYKAIFKGFTAHVFYDVLNQDAYFNLFDTDKNFIKRFDLWDVSEQNIIAKIRREVNKFM